MIDTLRGDFRRAGAGEFFLQDNLLVERRFHTAMDLCPCRSDPALVM